MRRPPQACTMNTLKTIDRRAKYVPYCPAADRTARTRSPICTIGAMALAYARDLDPLGYHAARPLARGSTVEHLTLDQGVPGSNPGAPAKTPERPSTLGGVSGGRSIHGPSVDPSVVFVRDPTCWASHGHCRRSIWYAVVTLALPGVPRPRMTAVSRWPSAGFWGACWSYPSSGQRARLETDVRAKVRSA